MKSAAPTRPGRADKSVVHDARLAALLPRIEARAEASWGGTYTPATVRIHTVRGACHEEHATLLRGSVQQPLSAADLALKVAQCVDAAHPGAGAAAAAPAQMAIALLRDGAPAGDAIDAVLAALCAA